MYNRKVKKIYQLKNKDKIKKYKHGYYLKNKEKLKDQCKNRRSLADAERRLLVQLFKSTEPCTDCGQYYHYSCMDFDHIRGNKINQVSQMIRGNLHFSFIEEEISKCELVCANCHRLRTWRRKYGSDKYYD